MDTETELVKYTELLVAQLREQNSLWRALVRGVFYGVGFIVGSVVVAALVIGLLLPFVKDIPGFSQAYQAGAGLINPNSH